MKLSHTSVPEFKYIKTIMHGIDLYLIDETYKKIEYGGLCLDVCSGQIALRNYLNVNYRIKENPWCIIKNDLNPKSLMYGKLSLLAIWSWNHYSLIPKIAAFRNDKLIAIKHSSHTNPDFVWWDRRNFPHTGCPVVIDGKPLEVDDERNAVIR